jgi:DNA processing protein
LGRLDLFQKTLFSIVGARHASQAGERIATQISEQLSAKSWVLVSGLARGIDACVHNASLHEGGTLAVIAGGIGHIYPPEHKKLYAEIAEKGAIISEDPLFISPHAGLFPKRNRIISGLSWGSLIVEASLRSGSLLTAKYAADQGRTVLAIPGHPLDFRARGANKLLKQGACLVETTDDILCEYTSSHRYLAKEDSPDGYEAMPALLPESSTLAKDIYGLLGVVPTSVSELSEKLGISPVSIRIALIEMELNGEIERYPGDAVIACM